jgi:WD40 repeat protein
VTAFEDGTARIWDAQDGAQLTVLAGHGEVVFAAAYSPLGSGIATASQDGTVRL